jgi:hypothetical protein
MIIISISELGNIAWRGNYQIAFFGQISTNAGSVHLLGSRNYQDKEPCGNGSWVAMVAQNKLLSRIKARCRKSNHNETLHSSIARCISGGLQKTSHVIQPDCIRQT